MTCIAIRIHLHNELKQYRADCKEAPSLQQGYQVSGFRKRSRRVPLPRQGGSPIPSGSLDLQAAADASSGHPAVGLGLPVAMLGQFLILQSVTHGLIQAHRTSLLPLLLPYGLLQPGARRLYVRLDHSTLVRYPGNPARLPTPRHSTPDPCRPAILSPSSSDARLYFQGGINTHNLSPLLQI